MPPRNTSSDAELVCAHLCVEFANGIDARDYPRVIDLFAVDGVLLTPVKAFQGHAEIARFLNGRPPTVVTRHLCTNVRVAEQPDGSATGICYVLLFKTTSGLDPIYPLKTPAPFVVEYHDTFVRSPAGWRIRERRIHPVFDPMESNSTAASQPDAPPQ